MEKKHRVNKTSSDELFPPLISAKELSTILGQDNIKVFDVRGIWGTNPKPLFDEYKVEHIPTASFLDWRKEFIETDIVPSLAQISSFTEAKQSFIDLGINKRDTVILYDNYNHMFAGRIWWAMRYWGFDNVRVLNGGFKNWKIKNLPVSQEIPNTLKGTFEPIAQEHLRRSLEDFIVDKEYSCVLDGRGINGYNGKPEDPRTGHIPGAISASYDSFIDKNTGLFIRPEEIKTLLNKTVPNWQTEKIICSCGAGYSGTVAMLALAQIGVESSLFDGSFNVWKQDPDRPIVQSF
ncbi:thiosulfate/3-mercaptopyruvate sulfurtransferase [Aquimarina amphilecti]|uniref:Thiosulfate/3-mercaptopyruvate sulfurtransferase n=1 Tax=Aquimarina amphilecti TaxID=1038014 RepID=A0A1H7Q8K4_AQUAM|nr:rhodanese-like domain-containing protein [Aquimarina amphilecti]SEL43637.1 thiosulfate/3-mercaptopyruvate sulfurtransferase [Aquimarina amphilecti]